LRHGLTLQALPASLNILSLYALALAHMRRPIRATAADAAKSLADTPFV
jgi:hypothetical protein